MRKLLLVTMLAGMSACSGAQPNASGTGPEPDRTVVPAPLEAVWWVILDVVREYQVPLETMDLGRGYLRSKRAALLDTKGQTLWVCAPDLSQAPELVLSIRAVPVNNGETSLEVAAVPVPDDGRWCESTGALEREVSRRVYTRWQELTRE